MASPNFSDPNYQRVIEQIKEAHPDWQQYQSWKQSQGTAPTGQAPAGTPGATSVGEQAQAAQTYSSTPGAAPTQNTTNQGTQDVVRNTYLQRATQGTTVDKNDPAFRQQVDSFAAAQERARRQHLTEQAERLSAQGLGNSGALDVERRLANERAGMATGSFEAQLVARELQNKRAEILDALQALSGQISGDQARALQMELAKIDEQLKQAGLGLQGQDLALRGELGRGALNVDLARLLLQNQQFGQDLGFRIADREAFWNNQALQYMWPEW